jgi:hypothetical protein
MRSNLKGSGNMKKVIFDFVDRHSKVWIAIESNGGKNLLRWLAR